MDNITPVRQADELVGLLSERTDRVLRAYVDGGHHDEAESRMRLSEVGAGTDRLVVLLANVQTVR